MDSGSDFAAAEWMSGWIALSFLNDPLIAKDHFQNFYEVSNTPPELISSSIPTTFIINKRGNIIMKKKGAANWNSDFIHTFLNKHI